MNATISSINFKDILEEKEPSYVVVVFAFLLSERFTFYQHENKIIHYGLGVWILCGYFCEAVSGIFENNFQPERSLEHRTINNFPAFRGIHLKRKTMEPIEHCTREPCFL